MNIFLMIKYLLSALAAATVGLVLVATVFVATTPMYSGLIMVPSDATHAAITMDTISPNQILVTVQVYFGNAVFVWENLTLNISSKSITNEKGSGEFSKVVVSVPGDGQYLFLTSNMIDTLNE